MLGLYTKLAGVVVALVSSSVEAAVPGSLRGAFVDVVQAQHSQLVSRLHGDALADAAIAYPKHADKLSAFAGFMGRQSAERTGLREQFLGEVQALLRLADRADQVAADRDTVAERLAHLRNSVSNAPVLNAAQTERYNLWLAKRESVVRQIGELEALHRRAQEAAERYRALADRARAGQHEAQQRAARILADFNAGLERHRMRVAGEREALVRAVADFKKWYDAQKLQLEQLQSQIHDAHDAWQDQSGRSKSDKGRANALAAQFNASGMGDDALRREARAALDTYQAQVRREATARSFLLALQKRGESLLQRTLVERKAREAVLARARESMMTLHGGLASDLEARRNTAEATIAIAQDEVNAEIAVAAAAVTASEAALVDRFGKNYADLHKAVAGWLEHEDSGGLQTLAQPVAPQARALFELARAIASEVSTVTNGARMRDGPELLAAERLQRSLASSYEGLVKSFDGRVKALRLQQEEYSALLERQSVDREVGLRRLLNGSPQLGDWGRSLKALTALLEMEYRHIVASMAPADGAGEVAPASWREVRAELRRRTSRFARLSRYVAGDSARLIEQMAASVQAFAPDTAVAGELVVRAEQLVPFVARPGAVAAFVTNVSTQAMAASAKKVSEAKVWRFLEGRYRVSPALGFVAVD